MKLYYSPGACSLACRISLHEAGVSAEYAKVDLKTKTIEGGDDYLAINPKGYVPMLVLDDGERITENVAVLALIAERHPELGPEGTLARIRLIEMLAYLSSEVHVAFKPLFRSESEAEMKGARETVSRRVGLLDERLAGSFLFGPRFSVADAYLFVMLRWARKFEVPLSAAELFFFDRVQERKTVRAALAEEGLIEATQEAPPPNSAFAWPG